MREAFGLARQGRALASPNPMVGAVVVRDGEVVGRGFHTYAGVQHAEVIALARRRRKRARRHPISEPGAVLHQGRTPPCADAMIAAGVARVVAPLDDPNPRVARRRLPPAARRRHRSRDGARIRRRSRQAE